MSTLPAADPACSACPSTPAIANIIDARPRDLGSFTVRRLLPAAERRLVGPFIFFDHMGPAEFAPGQGVNVRPHPHIDLATVTYLFEGEIIHRDSLGSHQPIRPGAINWMTAGRGIVHSERTSPVLRRTGSRVHGLQLWVALPRAHEETAPEFHHHPSAKLPSVDRGGAHIRVLAGQAYGEESPVRTLSPLFYADVQMPAGCDLPLEREHAERAVYVVEGSVQCGAERAEPGRMLVFAPQADVILRANADSRLVLIGGAPLDGERHVWWNFVSSSKERIERAKADWKAGRFPKVPGDEVEFIPLPE
jgi:redox-sensitive bicupin YhaK (pirin superfamily)